MNTFSKSIHTLMNSLKVKISTDPMTLLALLAVCEKNIVRYVFLVLNSILGTNIVSNILLAFLYTTLILMCVVKENRFGLKPVAIIMFITLSIGFTCLMYPQNAPYILDSNQFLSTIFPCLKFFIVGLYLNPNKKTMDLLGKASCLGILLEAVFVFVYMIPRGLLNSDEMNRAYQLLPNVLFTFNYAFNSKRKIPWLFAVLGAFYVLAMGTRGPILILIAYCIIKFLINRKGSIWKKGLYASLIAGFGVVFLNSNIYIGVLNGIKKIFLQLSLSTRVIDLAIKEQTLSYMSGRDELFEIALQKIKENPIFGYGVYGEWPWFQWNVHNMYLEILIHYGVILGIVLLFWLIHLVGKAYINTKCLESRDFILIWACFVFVRGFFGGSYLQFGVFFLIGFCVQELDRIKKYRISSSSV